jgi:hypothetical protein
MRLLRLLVAAFTLLASSIAYGQAAPVCVPQGQTPPIRDGHYFLISDFDRSLCLDKDSYSDDVQTYPCNGSVYQIFYFGRRDVNGCFSIHAIGSGQGQDAKYLWLDQYDFPMVSVTSNCGGRSLCQGNRWGVYGSVDGTFTLRNYSFMARDPACLDRRTQNGRAQVLGCNGVRGQNWVFQPFSLDEMRSKLTSLRAESQAITALLTSKKIGKRQWQRYQRTLQRQIDILVATLAAP